MLHTNFFGNQSAGSGDFWRVFTIYGRGGHLGHVTQMPRTYIRSPYPRRLHIKFGFDWPSGFSEGDVKALWTTDGHGQRPWVYYKLTYEPSAQVSLKYAKPVKTHINYCKDSKLSDRSVWANSADPDQTEEQSDQGLHCLQFLLHYSDKATWALAPLSEF